MLDIPAPLIRQLQDQVFAQYPGECCGLLVGPPGGLLVSRCLPLENIADRLHALDAATYPRTSRDAFMVNEKKLDRLVREAEAAGERWHAFYHSHIDCGAYFSAEDKKYAAPDGAAMFPEVLQLVIASSATAITEAKAFRWDGRDFALFQDLPAFARARP